MSFDIMAKIKTSSRKQVKRKNEIPTDRNKLKKEKAFLFFLAHNPHHLQNKKFLMDMITPPQMLVLREIATNELARNTPTYVRLKKKTEAMEKKAELSHMPQLQRNE